jgi:hypothetical protein
MNAYEMALSNYRLAEEQVKEESLRLCKAQEAARKAFKELDQAEELYPLDYADWMERNHVPIMSVDFASCMRDGDRRRIRLVGKPAVRCLGVAKIVGWGERTPSDARFRIAILDRDDGNSLKWLDFGDELYREFAEWNDCYAQQPGGMKGPDWVVKCTRSRCKPEFKLLRATNLDQVPFTDFEIKTFKDANLMESLLGWTKESSPPAEPLPTEL